MSSREIARQWFVPGDGIDRHVISADIQRYLGNDATVRPGKGTGEHAGVDGFWIKAYRNLTSAMIVDLRADSQRWRQEQRQTGTREPYVTSTTYQQSSAGRPSRRAGDSPRAPDYGSSARERIPASRMPQMDSMDVDPPSRASMFAPGSSRGEAYPPDSRASFPSDRAYQAEAAMNPGYGGRPPAPGYGSGAPGYPQQPNDQAPPGYVRQGGFYIPITGYEQPSIPSRAEPPYGGNPGFGGQPPYQPGREMPRYGGPEYQQDPSNAYPSPAATVPVPARDRGANSAAPSYGGQMPPVQYDQYGRPIKDPSPAYGGSSRESVYSRGNPQSSMDSRDRRDRRR